MATQKELATFVSNHIHTNQTVLVEKLAEIDVIFHEMEDMRLVCEDERTIFEWWLVDEWLLGQLERAGEAVLRTPYGAWWGRTTTGQAIYLDDIMSVIYSQHHA